MKHGDLTKEQSLLLIVMACKRAHWEDGCLESALDSIKNEMPEKLEEFKKLAKEGLQKSTKDHEDFMSCVSNGEGKPIKFAKV